MTSGELGDAESIEKMDEEANYSAGSSSTSLSYQSQVR
jgi:hypothetical protein